MCALVPNVRFWPTADIALRLSESDFEAIGAIGMIVFSPY
jgi:hypothetical protein